MGTCWWCVLAHVSQVVVNILRVVSYKLLAKRKKKHQASALLDRHTTDSTTLQHQQYRRAVGKCGKVYTLSLDDFITQGWLSGFNKIKKTFCLSRISVLLWIFFSLTAIVAGKMQAIRTPRSSSRDTWNQRSVFEVNLDAAPRRCNSATFKVK